MFTVTRCYAPHRGEDQRKENKKKTTTDRYEKKRDREREIERWLLFLISFTLKKMRRLEGDKEWITSAQWSCQVCIVCSFLFSHLILGEKSELDNERRR